jgi:hypothetical protein
LTRVNVVKARTQGWEDNFMAGKLGADFNASQPSDADLVKKGAQWIRDIKARIKATVAVCFNTETGMPLDNVFPSASLKDLNPSPAGSWNRVTVNTKGQVTAGEEEEVVISAKPYRWVYDYVGGRGPDSVVASPSLDTDDDGLNVATYSFTVPAGVTRLNVRVFGAGGGGGWHATTAKGGGGGGYTETHIDVSEGDVFLVWVGEGGIGMTSVPVAAEKGAMTKFEFDTLRYAKATGGEAGTATDAGSPGFGETTIAFDGWGPSIDFYGCWGTSTTGGPGGGGAGGDYGQGGAPASSGAGANPGGGGLVIVDYWKN